MKGVCQWQKYVVKCGGIFLFFEEISLFVDIQNFFEGRTFTEVLDPFQVCRLLDGGILLKKRKNRHQKEKILHA